jgi:hypothetical protein
MKACLLLTSPNGKQMITSQTNHPQLVEFIDCFRLTTNYVNVEDENKILDISQIAQIICDSNYNPSVEFFSKSATEISDSITENGNSSNYIRRKIKDHFLKNKEITFKEICKMFESLNYSLAALNNHFKIVRQELVSSGWIVNKIKNGRYKLEKTNGLQ